MLRLAVGDNVAGRPGVEVSRKCEMGCIGIVTGSVKVLGCTECKMPMQYHLGLLCGIPLSFVLIM